MANLLPGEREPARFAVTDEAERARLRACAQLLSGWSWSALAPVATEPFAALASGLAGELDELDEAPSLTTAQAILAEIEGARHDLLASRPAEPLTPTAPGDWLWYRPGRALASGEAEVASRGFFDVADRPPLVLWIEARARPRGRGAAGLDVAVLCWVPGDAWTRAADGMASSTSGALLPWAQGAEGPSPGMPGAR